MLREARSFYNVQNFEANPYQFQKLLLLIEKLPLRSKKWSQNLVSNQKLGKKAEPKRLYSVYVKTWCLLPSLGSVARAAAYSSCNLGIWCLLFLLCVYTFCRDGCGHLFMPLLEKNQNEIYTESQLGQNKGLQIISPKTLP